MIVLIIYNLRIMARLSYLQNSIEILNFNHSISDDNFGNPYDTTFDIKVYSNGFSGYGECLEIEYKEFKNFISELNDIYDSKTDYAKLSVCFGGDITIYSNKSGQIKVSGTVYGNNGEQSLNYTFLVDKTVLKLFIYELEKL